MNATRTLLAQHRQPMIKFLGKRSLPKQIDHTPHVHPAAPTDSLPNSFASYRQQAQQHGPLKGGPTSSSPAPQPSKSSAATSHGGMIGSKSGRQLGSIQPAEGEYFDRSELPARFRRTTWSQAEIDAIESGGASMFA